MKKLLSLFFVFLSCTASEDPLKIFEKRTKLGVVIFRIYSIKKAQKDKVPFKNPITSKDTHYIKAQEKKTGTVIAHCKTTKGQRGDGIFTSDKEMRILLPHLQVIAASLRKKPSEQKKKQSPSCILL